MRILIAATALVVAAVALVGTLSAADPDLGWHRKSGEHMLERGAVVRAEPFTYTLEGMPWVNHEWLYDLFLAAAERAGLLPLAAGLAFFAGVVPTLVWIARARGVPELLFAALGGVAVAEMTFLRAQIFSVALFALLIEVLRRAPERPSGLSPSRWALLAALFLFWSNFHGGFVLGLLFVAGWFVLHALTEFIGKRHIPRGRDIAAFIIGMAGLAAVTLLNPYGVLLWREIAAIAVSPVNAYISEWRSPLLHWDPFDALAAAMFLGSALIMMRKKLLIVLLPLVLFFGYLLHARLFPFFFLAALPVVFGAMREIRDALRAKGRAHDAAFLGAERALAAILVIFLSVTTARLLAPPPAPEPEHASRAALRARAVAGGNIYHDSGFGSAIVFEDPNRRAFALGHLPHRSDRGGFSPFLFALAAHLDPDVPLDPVFTRYDIRIALVFAPPRPPPSAPGGIDALLARIRVRFHPTPPSYINERLSALGWCAVYRDPLAVLYAKPGTPLCAAP